MALSGTIESSTVTAVSSDRYPRRLVLEWSASQSIDNNTSTISYTLRGSGTATSAWCAFGPATVKINGTTIYSTSSRFDLHSQQVLKTGSITVSHNTDGTCSVPVTISAALYLYDTSTTYNGSITLNTIPRASSIAASNANIGANPTFSITRASNNFTHTLRYVFGSLSGTIVSKYSATSYNGWTIPTSFYAQIPNAQYGTVTVYCDTYSGSTLIGTKSTTFRAYAAAADNAPIIRPDVRDTNATTVALTGDNTKLVRFYSNAQATMNPTFQNGATAKSHKITHASTSVAKAAHLFEKVEGGRFDFSVTDTRGYTTTGTITRTVIPYIKLTCIISKVSASPDGEIVVKINGNYFAGSFGATSNSLTIQVRMKTGYGDYGEWEGISYNTDTNNYSVNITKTGLDYREVYTFQARVIDKLNTIYSVELPVRCLPVFDWSENDFNINVDFKMNEQTILRHNKDANNTVLSASGGFIYFRPGGTNSTYNEIKFNPQGNIELTGDIIINGRSLKSLLGIT